MKHLSLLKKTTFACGLVAAVAMISSCSSDLAPEKAAVRLANSPTASVFSHNDVNSPRLRDCFEAGPLPERAERALVAWLHNSDVKEFNYIYPQYYVTTTNARGGSETVWALCSDGRGNLVGVYAPGNKRIPAWDMPTIGSYKLFVCTTSERQALSNAIMESLADAGYDNVRIDSRKAVGITDKQHLLSKPLDENEQKKLNEELKKKAEEAAVAAAKAKENAAAPAASTADEEDENDEDIEETDSSSDSDSDTSTDEDEDTSSDDEDMDLDEDEE